MGKAGFQINVDTTLGLTQKRYPQHELIRYGSLLLLDWNHSLGPIAAVPVNGGAITNWAAQAAGDLLALNPATLNCAFNARGFNTNEAIFELTGKGFLHGIYSQTNNVSDTAGCFVQSPSGINTYLNAGVGVVHQIAMASVFIVTRAEVAGTGVRLADISDQGANVKMVHYSTGGGVPSLYFFVRTFTTSNQTKTLVITISRSSAAGMNLYPMDWGNSGPGWSVWKNKCPSVISMFSLVEDLTVSGRLTDDFICEVNEWFARQCTPGGKFYDADTYTVPNI